MAEALLKKKQIFRRNRWLSKRRDGAAINMQNRRRLDCWRRWTIAARNRGWPTVGDELARGVLDSNHAATTVTEQKRVDDADVGK